MAYDVSNDFRTIIYSGDAVYDCILTIAGIQVQSSQLRSIKISSPIIDTSSDSGNAFHIGTFVSQKLEIQFKNLNGIDLTNNPEIELQIGVYVDGEFEYVPIGKYLIDELSENYQETCNITCMDYAIKFKPELDIRQFFNTENPDDQYVYASDLFEAICGYYGIEVGTYPDVNNDKKLYWYDNSISGKQYIMYLAELFGGNAKIERDGSCSIIPLNNITDIEIDALTSKSFKVGDTYELTRVCYDNGKQKFQAGGNVIAVDELPEDDDGTGAYYYLTTDMKYYIYRNEQWEKTLNIKNTLYIRPDNLFITQQEDINNIYGEVVGFKVTNLTCENRMDFSIDCWDIVKYTIAENEYYTLYDNTITFNGVSMGNVTVNLPLKTTEETTNIIESNVASQIRRIRTTINEQDNTLTTLVTETTGNTENISLLQQAKDKFEASVAYKDDLRNLENTLREDLSGLTNTITEKGGNNLIYYDKEFWTGQEVQRTVRRNVEIGDNLSNQTLYLNIPDGVDFELEPTPTSASTLNIIEGLGSKIQLYASNFYNQVLDTDGVSLFNELYSYNKRTEDTEVNLSQYTTSNNFGEVVNIESDSPIFQYIKIDAIVTEELLNIEEYTDTEVRSHSIADRGYLVNSGYSEQNIDVINGKYTISFNYKKLKELATGKIIINGLEYELTQTDWTKFQETIDIDTGHILIRIESDTSESFYITDLLINAGEEADIWTQNPNETRTDTVRIGKGIEVRSSITDTMLKADSDGVRIVQESDETNTVAEFTDKGTETKNIVVEDTSKLSGLFFQKVKYETVDARILPSEYQQVEYIQSTGLQYIVISGFKPTGLTTFDIDFMLTQLGSTEYQMVFGSRSTGGTKQLLLSTSSSGIISGDYGNTNSAFAVDATTSAYNNRVNVKTTTDRQNYYISINNGEIHSMDVQPFTGDYNMALFGFYNKATLETRNAGYRIYHCSFSEADTLLYDLIPCYKISNSVIGMYDLVNRVFYTNSGTGTFLIGAAIDNRKSTTTSKYTQTWISSLL